MEVYGIVLPTLYMYMSGGQNYLLAAMDMTKVGGPLSVVNVFAQI